MTKQEKDTYLRCLGYAMKEYSDQYTDMLNEHFETRLRHEKDFNTKKCPRQLQRVNRGKSRGYSSELKKGRELKASLCI